MVKKSRRHIYDSSVNPFARAEPIPVEDYTAGDDGDGVFREDDGVIRNDDYDDSHYFDDIDEEERQVTEFLDPKFHNPHRPDRRSRRSRVGRCARISLYVLAISGVLAVVVTVSLFIVKNHPQWHGPINTSSTIPPPPDDLADICSQESVDASVEGRFQCAAACEPSECCSYPDTFALSCLAENVKTCQLYEASCSILTDPAKKAGVPPAPSNLKEICSMQSLSLVSGMRKCTLLCSPRDCCFDTSGDSCASEPNCAGYSSCKNLVVHDNVYMQVANKVDEKCADPSRFNECKRICRMGSCCFGARPTCQTADDPTSFCDQFKSCNNMWEGSATIPPTMLDSVSVAHSSAIDSRINTAPTSEPSAQTQSP